MDFKLNIKNQRVDLFSDENIEIISEINEDHIYTNGLGEFTREFNIPVSPRNDRILEYYSGLAITGSLNQHKSIDASIDIDDIWLTGNVELKGVTYKNNKPHSYIVSFYGEQNKFISDIGFETLLSSVDFSSFQFTYTSTNVVNSWTGLPDYFVPLMSFERKYQFNPWKIWSGEGEEGYNNIATQLDAYPTGSPLSTASQKTGIEMKDLKPSYKMLKFIDKMLSHVNITGSFSTDTTDFLEELYILPTSEAGNAVAQDSYYVHAGLTGEQTLPLSSEDRLEFNGYYDDNQDASTGILDTDNYAFTSSAAGVYSLDLKLNAPTETIVGQGGTTYTNFPNHTYRIYKNGSVIDTLNNENVIFNFNKSYALESSDKIWITGESNKSTAKEINTTEISFTKSNDDWWGLTVTPRIPPKITILEFVSELLKTFNWVLEYDSNESIANIYTKEEWYNLGTTRDFSKYKIIDEFTARKLEVWKKLNFKHNESDDINNELYKRKYAKPYGNLEQNFDITYGEDELEKQSIFTVFPQSYLTLQSGSGNINVGLSPWNIHEEVDTEDFNSKRTGAVQNDFLLFYVGDLYTGSLSYPFNMQDQAFVGSNDFGTFYNTTWYGSFKDGASLNFDDNTLSLDGFYGGTETGLYNKFYSVDFDNSYNLRSKEIDFEFILPSTIQHDLKLNDLIYVDGLRYRIKNMKLNYLTGKTSMTLKTAPEISAR